MNAFRQRVVVAWMLAAGSAWAPSRAHSSVSATLLKGGGGFLVADGQSIVPLDLEVHGAEHPLESVSVRTSAGQVSQTQVVAPFRARFLLRMPKTEAIAELLIDMSFEDGTHLSQVYPLVITEPDPPPLRLKLNPSKLEAGTSTTAEVRLITNDQWVDSTLATDLGDITSKVRPIVPGILRTQLHLPTDLPLNGPSHAQLLASVVSKSGYNVATQGLSLTARITVQSKLPKGWRLRVEGAEEAIRPARAKNGRAQLKNVAVRYGSPVRIYRVRGRRKRELSVPLPTGRISTGVVLPLPQQAYADGGTGPTLAIALPPEPFGGAPTWRSIEVEGAQLKSILKPKANVRVLVLERPTSATTLNILIGGQSIGHVQLNSRPGRDITVIPTNAQIGERGAVIAEVRTTAGQPTSAPVPRAQLSSGETLRAEHLRPGVWRFGLPASISGVSGSQTQVTASIDALPVVVGEPLPPPAASMNVVLRDPVQPRRASGHPHDLGLAVALFGGSSFGDIRHGGFGLNAEVGIPKVKNHLSFRAGFEYGYGVANGGPSTASGRSPGQFEIQSYRIPIELIYYPFRNSRWSVSIRGGSSVRYDRGTFPRENGRARSGQWTVDGRAGLEGMVRVGPGDVVFGALVDGLGASTDALAVDRANVSGSLASVRGELGFRMWLR